MGRRWAPPGKGWVRISDCGSVAVWFRDYGNFLGVAVYLGNSGYVEPGRAEVFVALCPPGSWWPDVILDKPWRVRHLFSQHSSSDGLSVMETLEHLYGVPKGGHHLLAERREVPANHARHRRGRRRRWLPPAYQVRSGPGWSGRALRVPPKLRRLMDGDRA